MTVSELKLTRPYRPSWVDGLNRWLDRLPGHRWTYYLGLALALLVIQSAAAWAEGATEPGELVPAHVFLAGAIAFILGLLNYLNRRAEAALEAMEPAITADQVEREELRIRLTTLPAGRTLLAGALVLGIVLVSEAAGESYQLDAFGGHPISAGSLRGLYLLIWWIFGTLLYHTIHQLRVINQIYSQYTRINLFRMKPLYAFSSLTAFTAVSLTVLPYGFLLANGIFDLKSLTATAISLVFAIQVVAVITFLWPQLGIHRLQAAEKERLLDEASQRLQACLEELHRRIDGKQLDRVGEPRNALSALQAEIDTLRAIPTWPWQPETLRWLITALVLPLGLWIVQSILQRLLAP